MDTTAKRDPRKMKGWEKNFRSMRVSDLTEVLAIEHEAFPDPWSQRVLFEELSHNSFAHYFVMECRGKVVGYCGFWHVLDEAQITKVAVALPFRGYGWGEELLHCTIDVAKRLGVEKVTLEVRASNQAAQHLYEKMGFASAGIRPRFYTIEPEDAVIMWVMINETEEQNVYIGD